MCILKTCGTCKKQHKSTKGLAYLGIQETLDKEWYLKLYNCSCGSTMAFKEFRGNDLLDSMMMIKRKGA
jgi:hypothetical protein